MCCSFINYLMPVLIPSHVLSEKGCAGQGSDEEDEMPPGHRGPRQSGLANGNRGPGDRVVPWEALPSGTQFMGSEGSREAPSMLQPFRLGDTAAVALGRVR